MNDKARILIVDDDADIRSLLNELLTRAGYEVDEAPDGRTALRQLFEAPPSLVILDVTLCEKGGGHYGVFRHEPTLRLRNSSLRALRRAGLS